jgi:SnoaL-like domain
MVETTLCRYYRALDEGRIDDALQMLDPDLRFVMVLPAGTRRGRGRDDMGAYLGGRGVADRAHVVLRQSRDGDVEFLYGRVTDGGTTTGRFLSGARVGPDGLLASYEVTFDTEHVLVDDA